ncbi:MAG: hypothetical protein BJ554DRAFT_4, partial [Olpidium bornovanus]
FFGFLFVSPCFYDLRLLTSGPAFYFILISLFFLSKWPLHIFFFSFLFDLLSLLPFAISRQQCATPSYSGTRTFSRCIQVSSMTKDCG